MPHPRLDDTGRSGDRLSPFAQKLDFDVALVVAYSHVNRIVISRIAERTGLKAIMSSPEDAGQKLLSRWPGLVILDGGADNRDCEPLMESLAAQRLAAGGKAPFVILLQNATPTAGQPPKGGTIDAIVAKPITPERLQPLISSMMDRVRD